MAPAGDAGSLGPAGAPAVPGGSREVPLGPARYAAVLDNLDEVVFETDTEGRWTYLNAAWTKVTGHEVADSLGQPFLQYVHPDEREATLELFEAVLGSGADHCHHETRYLTADGDWRWIELRASVLLDDADRYIGNVGTIVDITERRQAQDLLAEQHRLLEVVARAGPLEDVLGAIAASLARWTGRDITVTTGTGEATTATVHRAPWIRVAVRARPGVAVATLAPDEIVVGEGATLIPIGAIHGDTNLGSLVIGAAPQPWAPSDGQQALVDHAVYLSAIAIGRALDAAQTRHSALHDSLTGLPNRALVTDRLQQALAASDRHDAAVALLLLDLDHFKVVNDTLGHETGDRVLQQVAQRVVGALRISDTVGRLGGDEFAIVLPEVESADDAERVAITVQDALRVPLHQDGMDFHVRGSIGVAVSSGSHTDPADMLRFADVAMYRAKRDGDGHALYAPEWDAVRLRGFDLAGQLRHAISADQLVLHYQPKVDLRTGHVIGVESLVRWQHPVRGLIAPADFVPLAEMIGAAAPLLRWVMTRALTDSVGWREVGFHGPVAVNLSADSLHDTRLPQMAAALLREEASARRPGIGVDGRLELEITESALMVDPDGAVAAMERLGELGISFSIDDFGTGYSSLSHLKLLPARAIKIDKSFVRDMDRDGRDASIVRTAVQLAHDLRMEVVAEGVEREEVRDMLTRLQCDSAQGYWFARPMPAEELRGWLASRAAHVV